MLFIVICNSFRPVVGPRSSGLLWLNPRVHFVYFRVQILETKSFNPELPPNFHGIWYLPGAHVRDSTLAAPVTSLFETSTADKIMLIIKAWNYHILHILVFESETRI